LPKGQLFSGFDSERESGQWWDEDRGGKEEKGREMARGEWRLQLHNRGNWNCSYKKITLLVCFFNIVVALYSLRSIYASLYIYSDSIARKSKSCQSFQDVFLSVSLITHKKKGLAKRLSFMENFESPLKGSFV